MGIEHDKRNPRPVDELERISAVRPYNDEMEAQCLAEAISYSKLIEDENDLFRLIRTVVSEHHFTISNGREVLMNYHENICGQIERNRFEQEILPALEAYCNGNIKHFVEKGLSLISEFSETVSTSDVTDFFAKTKTDLSKRPRYSQEAVVTEIMRALEESEKELRASDSPLAAVIVYGSWARNTTHAESDLDLMFVTRPGSEKALHLVRGILNSRLNMAQEEFHLPISIEREKEIIERLRNPDMVIKGNYLVISLDPNIVKRFNAIPDPTG